MLKKYHVSKNLFASLWEQGSINGTTGQNEVAGTLVRTKDYIPIKPNIPYSFSRNIANGYMNLRLYRADKSYIGSGSASTIRLISGTSVGNPMGNNLSFCCFEVIDSEATYIRFNDSSNNTSTKWNMVEGEYTQQTMPEYEPYGNTWTEIPYRLYATETDTLTTLPEDIIADGNNAEVLIKGNMQQTGTPSPSSITMPEETGERTVNLHTFPFTEYLELSGSGDNRTLKASTATVPKAAIIKLKPNTSYRISGEMAEASDHYCRIGLFNAYPTINSVTTHYYYSANNSFTIFTTGADEVWGLVHTPSSTEATPDFHRLLVEGSTALPFEPYGYKLPVLSGGVTNPVYLGEVESTRQIGMKIFDGSETWGSSSNNVYYTQDYITNGYHGYVENGDIICSHYAKSQTPNAQMPDKTIKITGASGDGYTTSRIYLRDTAFSSAAEVQAFMAAQYANGTPVIAWYPLATPTTGIVNEPLRKIGEYADTVSGITIPTITGAYSFDVNTSLKPSEVQLTYKGWHKHSPKVYNNGSWT